MYVDPDSPYSVCGYETMHITCININGQQNWARDNVPMFSGHRDVNYCIIMYYICWGNSIQTETVTFKNNFLSLKLYYEYVVAKLKKCRVPRSENLLALADGETFLGSC